MNEKKDFLYVLQNKDTKNFQKTDTNSGYPYDVKDPYTATQWNKTHVDEVVRYIRMFPQYQLVRVELSYTVTPLKVKPSKQGKIYE